MRENLQAEITAIIARVPDWIRQELASKETSTRVRAEEALGAMIAGGLKEANRA